MRRMDNKALENRVYEIDFKAELTRKALRCGQVFEEILDGQTGIPRRLLEAMRYMLLSGGKRIRAALVQWVCEMLAGAVNRDGDIAAAAVEMVHTYSLIHDDLPAMDDDDLRRGQPSCHKQFDEATAILAGDGLLTLAFEILAVEVKNADKAMGMIEMLSRAAGPAGMIAGQMADLEGEQSAGSMEELESIHMNKTARMFAASCGMGAIAGGAAEKQIEALSRYGLKIGLGFQIADDLLDVSASSEQLGKTAGKDTEQGKLTYPALVGVEKAREIAETLTSEALLELSSFGQEADILRRLAVELPERKK